MPGPRPPLVQAVQLGKRYVDGPAVVQVLAGLDLEVEAGERIAIVGESGVGKSTLLHLLGALDRPTSGRILFDGEDVFSRPEAELAAFRNREVGLDRKSTRLNSSHLVISYAVFCLKKKKKHDTDCTLQVLELVVRLTHRFFVC